MLESLLKTNPTTAPPKIIPETKPFFPVAPEPNRNPPPMPRKKEPVEDPDKPCTCPE